MSGVIVKPVGCGCPNQLVYIRRDGLVGSVRVPPAAEGVDLASQLFQRAEDIGPHAAVLAGRGGHESVDDAAGGRIVGAQAGCLQNDGDAQSDDVADRRVGGDPRDLSEPFGFGYPAFEIRDLAAHDDPSIDGETVCESPDDDKADRS